MSVPGLKHGLSIDNAGEDMDINSWWSPGGSAGTADVVLPYYLDSHYMLAYMFLPPFFAYFLVLRCVYGAWTIRGAKRARKPGGAEERYWAAFSARKDLQYHQHWAIDRGDEGAAEKLGERIAEVDANIDVLEAELLAAKDKTG